MQKMEELSAKMCSCTEALNSKIDGSNGKRAILLCGGTGCLSSNSEEITVSKVKVLHTLPVASQDILNRPRLRQSCSVL